MSNIPHYSIHNPLDGAISSGAPLMIPRSMLDSIEVVFPSIESVIKEI